MEKIFSRIWSVRITVSLGIISLTVLFLLYFYIVFYLPTVFGSGLGLQTIQPLVPGSPGRVKHRLTLVIWHSKLQQDQAYILRSRLGKATQQREKGPKSRQKSQRQYPYFQKSPKNTKRHNHDIYVEDEEQNHPGFLSVTPSLGAPRRPAQFIPRAMFSLCPLHL